MKNAYLTAGLLLSGYAGFAQNQASSGGGGYQPPAAECVSASQRQQMEAMQKQLEAMEKKQTTATVEQEQIKKIVETKLATYVEWRLI